ncbi:MAG TPA: F0F1 ATP synthase subunit A [Ruminococcaceae bacterium]|nr:F0F1 ATP synthase subunit A [Oscillospiraceae bacterium]
MTQIILLCISAVSLCFGFIGLAFAKSSKTANGDDKKAKKRKRLSIALTLFGGWLLIGTLVSMFSAKKAGLKIEFALFSDRISIFGFSIAKTVVISFCITGTVLILGTVFRLFVFPKFSPDDPKGFQNVIEIAVEAMENFAKNSLLDYSGQLAPYMFTLAVYMIFSAFTELFGLRAPTSDLTSTFAMGLITFFLINYYGIKKKGVAGRIKGMAKPTPLVFPMKILSDVAVPVSLACRLFGNMLGGMIVMDLLKSVLGGYAVGIPPVAGLYFNLFHPAIQTYIFIILSMTFINEAIE